MSGFLSIIVDCSSYNWGLAIAENGTSTFKEIISAIIALCNAHLFSSFGNRLLLLLADGTDTDHKRVNIFTNERLTSEDGTASFSAKIEELLKEALTKNSSCDDTQISSNFSRYVSLSICAFQKFKKRFTNSPGNIVLINLSKDPSSENPHNNGNHQIDSNNSGEGERQKLMNLFFASRQYSLRVHVVSFQATAPILQQACDITNGKYMYIEQSKLLAHNLLSHCLCNPTAATAGQDALFSKSSSNDIDYRATCHCHNQLLDIGWVCSVCLAITCNNVPFCKICNAVFPRPLPQQKRNANA